MNTHPSKPLGSEPEAELTQEEQAETAVALSDPALSADTQWSRARAQTKERLSAISQLMIDGRWVRGVTGKQLAADWGCSIRVVENLASEASRWHSMLLGEDGKEKLRQRILIGATEMLDRVRASGTPKDFADIGRIALPLAGVPLTGPMVAVQISANGLEKPTNELEREAARFLAAVENAFKATLELMITDRAARAKMMIYFSDRLAHEVDGTPMPPAPNLPKLVAAGEAAT